MNFLNKLTPALLLRIGLALTFLYAAISGFIEPDSWVGFFPAWMSAIMPAYAMLVAFGLFEIAIAVALLLDKYTYWAAHIYALTMAGIVISTPGALFITFRDIGLAFAAWALAGLVKK